MKSISISDIASSLNISRNTVSKVLNNRGHVSDETKEKIIKKAVESNYKNLSNDIINKYNEFNKKNNCISVIAICPEFSDFWTRIINSITSELNKIDCPVVYNFLMRSEESNFKLPFNVTNGQITGIIVINLYDTSAICKISETNIPVVYLDVPVHTTTEDANGDIILLEGQNSIFKITKNLLNKGFRKLGFIGDITYSQTIYERWLGFIRAHEDFGIKSNIDYCLLKSDMLHLYQGDEIHTFLENLPSLPEAFVCANDFIAYTVIQKLKLKGKNMPEDIMVTGYDNVNIPLVSDNIALTTVDVNTTLLGKRLVEQILWRINNPSRPFETIRISTRVIMRFN